MRAIWMIPVTIALGALASHLLFPVLSKPAAVPAQPLAVVTAWGWSGVLAWLLYAATMCLAGGFYVVILFAARHREIARRSIVIATLLAALAAFFFRFMFSSDVYAYAAYGALAATHQNPYVHRMIPPSQLVDASWTAAIGYEWPSLPACVYGPAFVAFSQAIVVATHFDLAHALLSLRLLEIGAFAGAIALAPNSLLAIAVGLNPVVLSTVAEGHNDALILLAIALAYRLAQKTAIGGGVLAGLSALLKATGGIAALGLAYVMPQRRFAWGVAAGVVLSLLLQFAATRFAGGFQPLAATDFVGTPQAAVAIALRGALALGLAFWALHLAGRAARVRALAVAALLLWAIYPNDYPWYGVWLLPLAAATLDRPEGVALLVLTFSSTLRYLSDVYGYAPAAPWLEVIVVAIPVCVAAWRPARAGKLQVT
ncbi:MAG: hypothetical protein ACRENA_16200 [Vulcanimicrobiaceae bacterium]